MRRAVGAVLGVAALATVVGGAECARAAEATPLDQETSAPLLNLGRFSWEDDFFAGEGGRSYRANLLPQGGPLEFGPSIDYQKPYRLRDLAAPWQKNMPERKPGVGGFIGYRPKDGAESFGLNLRLTEPVEAPGAWLFKPSLNYTQPLHDNWQINTRLFGAYAPQAARPGHIVGVDPLAVGNPLAERMPTEGGFQDFGVGVGLGFSMNPNWTVQTQAGYQRQLRAGEPSAAGKDAPAQQFFGGVILDYRF